MNNFFCKAIVGSIALSPFWFSIQAFALSRQTVLDSGLSSLQLRQLISQTTIQVLERVTPEWVVIPGADPDYPDAINQVTLSRESNIAILRDY
jgi:hypothetical protein